MGDIGRPGIKGEAGAKVSNSEKCRGWAPFHSIDILLLFGQYHCVYRVREVCLGCQGQLVLLD